MSVSHMSPSWTRIHVQTRFHRVYVTNHHTGGGRLAEPMGNMDQNDELDPGGAHDAGRSGEEDPG